MHESRSKDDYGAAVDRGNSRLVNGSDGPPHRGNEIDVCGLSPSIARLGSIPMAPSSAATLLKHNETHFGLDPLMVPIGELKLDLCKTCPLNSANNVADFVQTSTERKRCGRAKTLINQPQRPQNLDPFRTQPSPACSNCRQRKDSKPNIPSSQD